MLKNLYRFQQCLLCGVGKRLFNRVMICVFVVGQVYKFVCRISGF